MGRGDNAEVGRAFQGMTSRADLLRLYTNVPQATWDESQYPMVFGTIPVSGVILGTLYLP